MIEHRQLFIGGQRVPALASDTIDVVCPSTEAIVATVPAAGRADVDASVMAARAALDDGPWAFMRADERAALLRAIASQLYKREEEIAQLITTENGSPITLSRRAHTRHAIGIVEQVAEIAENFRFEELRPCELGNATVVHEPVGVVAAISAWNGPLYLALSKLAPALAAGCSVVLKPAPEAPLDAFVLADACRDAGLPDGVVNIVTGGRAAGEALVAHPEVDMVSFTGSTDTGREIMLACVQDIKRSMLELGGKSPAIILDDVDLEAVLRTLVRGMTMGSGQVCFLLSRVLVPRARHDEVVDAICDGIRALQVGDPFDESTALGPLVSARHRERVEGYVQIGMAEGARLALGGGRPRGLDRGWYVEPTVFVDVEPHHRIAREEIFGPVISVLAYDDEDAAVGLANDSDFGLGSAVFTADVDRGIALSRRLRSGLVGVNAYGVDRGLPFGGFKQSGIGREGGVEGLRAYLEPKTVVRP
jgi:betaine-aldehyde dehydrogenase